MRRRNVGLRWGLLLGWLACCECIIAQVAEATKLPLTNAMVVQALRVRGVEVNAANVHLPASLYLAGPSATLAVAGVGREGNKQIRLRLRCVRIADCIAFTAMLDVDGPVADAVLSLGTESKAGHTEGISGTTGVALRAGDHLALSIQQAHLVLQMPCLAVDTGGVGETIRVATLDRRRLFRAVVTGPAAATGVAE